MSEFSVERALLKARSLLAKGHAGEAETLYKEIIAKFPGNQKALKGLEKLRSLRATATGKAPQQNIQILLSLYSQNRLSEVVARAAQLIAHYPGEALLYNISGSASLGLLRYEDAAESFRQALRLQPDYSEAHNNLGIALYNSGRKDEAVISYQRALALNDRNAQTHYSLGVALQELGRLEEAAQGLSQALMLEPHYTDAHVLLGDVLRRQGHLTEALAHLNTALALQPDIADAHNNLGNIFHATGELEKSIMCYRRALEISPRHEKAHNNLGTVLQLRGRFEEAVQSYQTAIALNPFYAEAYYNMATALQYMGQTVQAIASLEKTIALKPDHHLALSKLLQFYADTCDWEAIEPYRSALPTLGLSGMAVLPFAMLLLEDAPERHLLRAQAYAEQNILRNQLPLLPAARSSQERIKIGYFSGDFRHHPMSYLMAGLFEKHDRGKFEIHGFDMGPPGNDDMRQRLIATFDHFHDVRAAGDDEIVRRARETGIDVAVDLMGYTEHDRPGIYALRAAPVQINYLGYPGSMGADFMDYIIGDGLVTPHDSENYFSEKIIRLPYSYQVNGDARIISEQNISRAECGLPEHGIVFCCFNRSNKITPSDFDVWMRLLVAVEGSVLWLLQSDEVSAENLNRQARLRGVAANRLIYAPRRPLAEHLGRQRCADIFLDTFIYNAHTTASDALWAGLPVITKLGHGFPARVAASLLAAVGMPDLITKSEDEYYRLALSLATDPSALAATRARLAENLKSAPLFNTALTARHLEEAFRQAHCRYQSGLSPDHIFIQA